MAAQHRMLALGAANRTGIGSRDDHRIDTQRGIGRQAEHIIEASSLAEHHDLRASIMPVAAVRYVGVRQWRRISRTRHRIWPAASLPEGVLPVRSSIATGRPVAVS